MNDINVDVNPGLIYDQYLEPQIEFPLPSPFGGVAITSINGITGPTVTFAGGTSGFSFAPGGSTITLVSPLTTKGDLYTHNSTAGIALPVGTDTFVLSANSGEATGLKWIAAASTIAIPAGSIPFGNATGTGIDTDVTHLFWDDTNNRLAIGTNSPTVDLDIVSAAASTDVKIRDGSRTLALSSNFSASTAGVGTITNTPFILGTNGIVAITLSAAQLVRFNAYGAGVIQSDASGNLTSGTIGVASGGTGITSYAVGDLLYASASTTLSKLADVAAGSYLRSGGVTTAPVWSTTTLPNSATTGDLLYASASNVYSNLADVATGNALISGGVTTAPSWGKIGLTTHVSGTLAEGNGGTNQSTYAQGDLLYASAANTLSKLAKNASSTRYLSNTGTSNNPAWAQVDLTNGVTGTLPAGSGGTGITSLGTGVATALGINVGSAGAFLLNNGDGSALTGITATQVGLGNVTNDTQTKAAIVPNTAPSAGQVLVGNAGNTAYAKQTISGSGATMSLSSAGVMTISAIANASLANSAITINGTSVSLGGTRTLTLASSDFANQGTTSTVLHGNAAGNPSFAAVSLTADITGTLAAGNGGTGITSLGTGIATWLGTPSSANLAAALTDETGTGLAVFATTPTFTTSIIIGGAQDPGWFQNSNSANAAARNWGSFISYNAFGDWVLNQSNALGGSPYSAGTTRIQVGPSGGFQVGSPTGGDKGAGTANFASDIYRNNTAYVNPHGGFEYAYTGKVERYADRMAEIGLPDYKPLSLQEMEAYTRKHFHFPYMGDEEGNGYFIGGERFLLITEELAVHLFKLDARVRQLEAGS